MCYVFFLIFFVFFVILAVAMTRDRDGRIPERGLGREYSIDVGMRG